MKFVVPFWILGLFSFLKGGSCYNGDDKDEKSECPLIFKGRCHCGMGRYPYWKPLENQYIVNCTNTGFTATDMLEHLPEKTQILIFTGNKIPETDWNLLGMWNENENLESIDLSDNRFEYIPGKSFHKVKNVKRLVLNHNNLRISGSNSHPRLLSNFYNLEELHLKNAFSETVDSGYYLSDLKDIFISSNMTKLKKIHLEQNEIWKIKDENMFCDLPSLSELYLGDNQLQSVDFNLLCLKNLTLLDLKYNKIRRLDQQTLRKLDNVFGNKIKRININENPLQCDCHLRSFYDWITTTDTNIVNKEDLRCFDGWPKGNAGKRLVNIKRLPCPPQPVVSSQKLGVGTSITHALLLILLLLVAALLAVFLWVNRTLIRNRFTPLMTSVQKSMQYKTVGREEEIMPPEVNV